jgi:hypothetical protein
MFLLFISDGIDNQEIISSHRQTNALTVNVLLGEKRAQLIILLLVQILRRKTRKVGVDPR